LTGRGVGTGGAAGDTAQSPVTVTHHRVGYADTDQMGRAHHARYLVWCEVGRTEYLRSRGRSYRSIEADGILLPVARVEIDFRAPLGYDGRVRVETRVLRFRSRMITFSHGMTVAEGTGEGLLAAVARTTVVATDRDGRARTLPDSLREALLTDPRDSA